MFGKGKAGAPFLISLLSCWNTLKGRQNMTSFHFMLKLFYNLGALMISILVGRAFSLAEGFLYGIKNCIVWILLKFWVNHRKKSIFDHKIQYISKTIIPISKNLIPIDFWSNFTYNSRFWAQSVDNCGISGIFHKFNSKLLQLCTMRKNTELLKNGSINDFNFCTLFFLSNRSFQWYKPFWVTVELF